MTHAEFSCVPFLLLDRSQDVFGHQRTHGQLERRRQRVQVGVDTDVERDGEGGFVRKQVAQNLTCGCVVGLVDSIIIEENPLAEFVELPDSYMKSLWYSNVLCGVIRGSLDMVRPTTHLLSCSHACVCRIALTRRRTAATGTQRCVGPVQGGGAVCEGPAAGR